MFIQTARCRRRRLALAAVWLIAAGVPIGCQPEGAGSIKVGDPSRWRKPLAAPAGKAPRKTSRTERPGDPPPYKSLKDHVRERSQKP